MVVPLLMMVLVRLPSRNLKRQILPQLLILLLLLILLRETKKKILPQS
jgi:hypothetical protein